MEEQYISLLVQAGAVGIALYLAYLGHKKDIIQEEKDKRALVVTTRFMEYMKVQESNFNKIVTDQMIKNTEMMGGVKTTLQEVIPLLKRENGKIC
jgi:hypothetical protein